MARFDYARAAATATRLIDKFGQDCVHRGSVKGGDDWSPTFQSPETDVRGVDLNRQAKDDSGQAVGVTKRTVYVEANEGMVIAKGDDLAVGVTKATVTAETVWNEVDEARPLAPAGLYVMWEVDLVR